MNALASVFPQPIAPEKSNRGRKKHTPEQIAEATRRREEIKAAKSAAAKLAKLQVKAQAIGANLPVGNDGLVDIITDLHEKVDRLTELVSQLVSQSQPLQD